MAWALENGGEVYPLDGAMQIAAGGRVYSVSLANPWQHPFVRELVASYANRGPVVGVLGDVNGRGGVIYVYRLRVVGKDGVLWEGVRAYHVSPEGTISRIPVNYIYYNLKPTEASITGLGVREDPNVKVEAAKDAYEMAEEIRREERETASILENEILMRYELKIRSLKQSTKISEELVGRLIKECEKELNSLRERVESVRADEPRLVAAIRLISLKTREAREEEKRAVELAGMKAVMEYEVRNSRVPKDVSEYYLGYDIKSVDPRTGEIRYIEVKSFRTSGDPELTEHEYEVAKILSSRYWLYVVNHALSNPRIITIRDPVNNAEIIKVSKESYRIVRIVENRYIVRLRG